MAVALSEKDIQEMKQALLKADHNGDGSVSLGDLTQIFQELDDWSLDDLHDLFLAAGGLAENSLPIPEFVSWVMQDNGEDDDAPMPGIERDDDDDEDNNDHEMPTLKAGPPPEPSPELVDMEISHAEWLMLASLLDQDTEEAQHSFEHWFESHHKKVPTGADQDSIKLPLKAYLDEHGISVTDSESLHHVEEMLKVARQKLANGESHTANTAEIALPVAIEQVVRVLDMQKRPCEHAMDLVNARQVTLSRAARNAISKFEDRHGEFIEKVCEAKVNPPILTSNAGRQGNREHCCEEVRAIVAQCRLTGSKFTDKDWDLTSCPEKVLYVDGEQPGFDCTVGKPSGYKRLTEIIKDPVLFKGGLRPGDIVQGQIGTCFLLGALGAMVANDPNSIKSAFMEYDIDSGVYGIRLMLNGEWVHTIIDDYMPVDRYGRILYAKGHDRDEVWCPLLEKAFCKLHTCYEMCDGGTAAEATTTCCGGCSGKFVISKKNRDDPKLPDSIFQAIKNARARGWVLTTTFTESKITIGQGAKSGQGKCGEDVLSTGLVRGHVYSVLKAVEAEGNRLVCCRNPWGQGEWQGKWSDSNTSGEWTDSMKAATGYQGGNDGTFWISVEDFVATSGGVDYTRVFGSTWKKISQYAYFQKGSMQATALWPYKASKDDEVTIEKGGKISVETIQRGWWKGTVVDTGKTGYFPGNYVKLDDRPIARFDLDAEQHMTATQSMMAVVMLMQPLAHTKRTFHKRRKDGLNYKDLTYPAIMLCVVGPDGKVALKVQGKKCEVGGEICLHGGKGVWKVYAASLDGTGEQFTVRAHVKDGTATLTEAPDAHLSEIAKFM